MPINDQIPLSAGPAGAARIDSAIPASVDSRITMGAKPFDPIDVLGDTGEAYKLASGIEQFKAQQGERLEAQRIREEKQRDREILSQYQQSGGDLFSADGMQIAAKELGPKLSVDSLQGLSKRLTDKRASELKEREGLVKMTDDELNLVSRNHEETSKIMNRALSVYDDTLKSTTDPEKAKEAFTAAKTAMMQAVQNVTSPTTGKPLYPPEEAQKFVDMSPEQLRSVVSETKWKQNAIKEESANRLRNSQSDAADALVEKREADAKRDVEKNRILAEKVAAMAGKPLSEEDAATMAEMVRVNGVTSLSRFGLMPNQRQQVIAKVTELNSGQGVSAREGAVGVLNIKSDQKSVEKMVSQLDAVTSYEKTMETIGGKLIEVAKKVDTTGVPVLERWIRAGKSAIAGDPDVTEFNSRMQTFKTEAARVISNPNLTGVLSDSARHEIGDTIPNAGSIDQIVRGVETLISEGRTRRENLSEQIADGKARIMKGAAKDQPSAPGSPSDFPKVTKDDQAKRDGTRREILDAELKKKQADLASAASIEDRTRIGMDIIALKREIDGVQKSTPVGSLKKPTVSNW